MNITATIIEQILAADIRAASVNSPDFDALDYLTSAKFVLDAEAQGAGITNNVKLQASAALANGYEQNTDGTNNIVLRNDTADNIKLAAGFAQSGARQIKTIVLMLKRVGTIAGSKEIYLTIEGDNAGDPDGTPIGTSVAIDPTTIGTSYEAVTFTFAVPVDVADGTTYHIVLQGDYAVSSSNHICWRAKTEDSGGNANIYDAAWAADATLNFEVYTREYNFADISGAAFTEVGNVAAHEDITVDMDAAKRYIRAVLTIAGGSATGATVIFIVGFKQY